MMPDSRPCREELEARIRELERERDNLRCDLKRLRDEALVAAAGEGESRFRAIIDRLESIPVQGYDAERRVIYWNRANEKVYGYTREEALGRRLEDLIIPEDLRSGVVAAIDAWLHENRPIPSSELVLRDKDNRPVPVFSSHVMWESLSGVKELFCIDLDLRPLKDAELEKMRLERQFQQIQKLESIGRLASGIAHDLNNLLIPILGYGETLVKHTSSEDPRHEMASAILNSAQRARQLVRQLLTFGRRQAMAFTPVQLNAMLKEFQPLLRRTIQENIDIQLDLEPMLPLVDGDPGQLEQVVLNLAVNARDAMPAGGKLVIATTWTLLAGDSPLLGPLAGPAPGSYVTLKFTDDGCGMDPTTREKIFEPFFSTRMKSGGTGLGLSTVYGIVRQHRGGILVESVPGQGTTFSVYLPVSSGAAAQPDAGAGVGLVPAAEAGSATGQPVPNPRFPAADTAFGVPGGAAADASAAKTVLLVEDNPEVLELVSMMLEERGFRVLAAANGNEAVAQFQNCPDEIDLLLTDVIMPEMDGRQLYEYLSAVCPGLRVLYMSGYADNIISRHGVLERGTAYLQKPFTGKILAGKLHQVLGA